MKRYILIGGNPYKMYTGTTTFTSLYIIGKSDSLEEINKMVNDKFDECNGLLMVIDTTTGEEV